MTTEVTQGEGAPVSDFVLYSYVLKSVASYVSMFVCVCVCVCVCVWVCTYMYM